MNLKELIIFENEDFIVINKPAGMLSIPDREGSELSLKKMLQNLYGQIFTVHRLDKGTSGLIVFAKNEATHKYLSQQFENRQTEKIYTGLVLGSLAEKKGSIDQPLSEHPAKKGVMVIHKKGKEALTDFEVIADFGMYSWMRFQIHTGRTHQIRVHMKSLGHPLACDEIYGDGKPVFLSSIKFRYKLSKNDEEERPMLNRMALHAYSLKFKMEKQDFEFEAPIPKDLRATLQQLSKIKKVPLNETFL